jgi:hypothetical protein
MKKWILLAGLVGFLAPVISMVLAFATFTEPQSPSADRFWSVIHITCPFWDMIGSVTSLILVCFLNAGLYGLIAFLIVFSVGRLIAKGKRAAN